MKHPTRKAKPHARYTCPVCMMNMKLSYRAFINRQERPAQLLCSSVEDAEKWAKDVLHVGEICQIYHTEEVLVESVVYGEQRELKIVKS